MARLILVALFFSFIVLFILQHSKLTKSCSGYVSSDEMFYGTDRSFLDNPNEVHIKFYFN